MLSAKPAEARGEEAVSEGDDKLDAGDSVAVVPLAIPLLTGPATISTVVIYADKTRHWWEHAVLAGYGVVVGLAVWAAFSMSGTIARVLGKTGINVMTRLMGLILAALAVEVIPTAWSNCFPSLPARSRAEAPRAANRAAAGATPGRTVHPAGGDPDRGNRC